MYKADAWQTTFHNSDRDAILCRGLYIKINVIQIRRVSVFLDVVNESLVFVRWFLNKYKIFKNYSMPEQKLNCIIWKNEINIVVDKRRNVSQSLIYLNTSFTVVDAVRWGYAFFRKDSSARESVSPRWALGFIVLPCLQFSSSVPCVLIKYGLSSSWSYLWWTLSFWNCKINSILSSTSYFCSSILSWK